MILNALKRPQAANDFKVTIRDQDWKAGWLKLFADQTVSVKVDLVKRRLTMHVRQLATGHIQDLIFHILQKERLIDEVRVSPAKRQSYEYIFVNGTMVAHEVQFDLYVKDAITHRIVFDFNKVRLHSNETHSIQNITDID